MKLLKKYFPLAFFVVTFLLMAKVILNNGYPDFSNFYFGPFDYFNGINPYIANVNLFTPTTYPPIIFLIFYPLSFLSLFIAEKLWTIASIISLIASLYLLFKTYNQKLPSSTGLLLSSLVFLSFPIKFTLGMGQVNIFILLLLSLYIYFHNKSANYSGIFAGLAILIKFFPFLLIFYLLVKKQWNTFIFLFLTIALGIFLTFILIKPDINKYYIQKVLPTLFDSWKGDYYNQSLSGLLTRLNLNLDTRIILRDLISLFLLTLTFSASYLNKMKDKFSVNLGISVIITLSLLLNSFSWQHHFAWMVIPFFVTFFYLQSKKKTTKYYVILGICYALISWNFKNPLNYPVVLQSHVFFGALLMLLLQTFLLLKDGRTLTSKKS